MTKHKAIKQLPIRDRYKISKSNKDFIILRTDKSYILTNDLVKHRAEYMSKGGTMFKSNKKGIWHKPDRV